MHSWRVVLVAMAVVLPAPILAQWPTYPTPGVARTAGGEVDLNAPAPRASDGKPDFTGIWENPTPIRASGSISGTGGAPPLPGAGGGTAGPAPPGMRLFFDIGSGVSGGLPYRQWAADLRKKRMAEGSKDNPDALCLPMGNMQLHTHPQPRKIIQTPRLIVILYEGNAGIRQIFLDGRPLPSNDPQPWWYGYSTGRWEGDTLVVESAGFRDGGWLDVNGSPFTDQGKMTERFRRVNMGSLEIQVTVDDPKAYERPWTVTVNQRLMPDTELIEFICNENEKAVRYIKE